MPGIHPALVESMLFLQPSLLLVPRACPLIPFGALKKHPVLHWVLGTQVQKYLFEAHVAGGEGKPVRALGAVCAGVSQGAEIRFYFLGLFLAHSLPCPTGGVSVSRESESVG